MNSELTHLMARARVAEMSRVAEPGGNAGARHTARRRSAGPGSEETPVTVRFARPGDELALIQLAQLDSAEPLTHPVILAESRGELIAAASLEDRRVVADPFEPTATLVDLLLLRADQIQAACVTTKPRPLSRLRTLLATR